MPSGFQKGAADSIDVRETTSPRLRCHAGAANYRRMTDSKTEGGDTAQRFVLKAEEGRSIAFDGEPVTELPQWGGVAQSDGVRFILHPPLDFEIAYRIPDYFIFTPFSRAVCDLSVDDGPKRRKAWAAGSAFFVPPETCVRARMADPVEFLCIVLSPERAEAAIERAARGHAWAAELIEDFTDPGFAALQQEIRRSLLGDPLVEPAYLGGLADAMLARIACRLLGRPLERGQKDALSSFVLRRVMQKIEDELSGPIRVEDLAAEAGLSRSHFSRAFQSVTGESPQEFIIGRRLAHARELLAASDRPIAEIAAVTGFSSQAHLSTAFKKRLGLTPARYRDSFDR